MGYEIHISGTIGGISKESFELIEEDLLDAFGETHWMENAVEIYSYGNHGDDLQSIFNKIAFCIDGDGNGQLDISGEDDDDWSVVFFVARQWKQLYVDIVYPENPFIKKGGDITYMKTAYVQVIPSMLNAIKSEIDGWAKGDENVCILLNDLKDHLTEGNISNKTVFDFFSVVCDQVIEPVGDVVFHI